MGAEALRGPWPWRLLLLALLLVVSWFAFAPVHFDDRELPLDKLRHLAAFATLAWVATQGFGRVRRAAVTIPAALLGYGVFIELVQSVIPGRQASAADVVADAVGLALGLLAARVFSPVR